MVSVTTLIEVVGLLIVLGGAVGAFYSMQTRQNMKINELNEKVRDLRTDLIDEKEKRIELSEAVIEIKKDLEHILSAVQEIKDRPGC